MKKIFVLGFILALSAWFSAPILFAAPERMQIKSEEARAREENLKTAASAINLAGIEDPEARAAIQQILNYLAPERVSR